MSDSGQQRCSAPALLHPCTLTGATVSNFASSHCRRLVEGSAARPRLLRRWRGRSLSRNWNGVPFQCAYQVRMIANDRLLRRQPTPESLHATPPPLDRRRLLARLNL